MVEGKDAAVLVSNWISGAYVDRLHVEVLISCLDLALTSRSLFILSALYI